MALQQEPILTANDNLARLRHWTDSVNRGTPAFAETSAPEATIEIVGGPPDARDRESFANAMTDSPCCVSRPAVRCG